MERKLQDGGTLQLRVPGDMFATSVHSVVGCTGCHSDIDLASHPPADKKIPSAQLALTMIQVCRSCHAEEFTNGKPAFMPPRFAPAIRRRLSAPTAITRMPSSGVQQEQSRRLATRLPVRSATLRFTPPPGSMHAKARIKSVQSAAPICSGCHGAHAVKPTWLAVGEGPEATSLGCHTGVLAAEMASKCRLAFRGGVLPRLPCPKGTTQSRSHADGQQRRAAA